jgi:hypothetical protein
LRTAFEVDDGQAVVAEEAAIVEEQLLPVTVRAAVGK